jgi:hypothetical protein
LKLSATQPIYDVDVQKIEIVNADKASICDATGIEALTGLRVLMIPENCLANLNVSACLRLETLCCLKNQLTNLNVSACTNLQYLDCWKNQLRVLNISSNTSLTHVDARDNPITNIVVWWTPPAISNKPANLELHYDGNPTFSNPK